MSKVCAIGELLIDFTPSGKSSQGNNLFEQNPGGGPANVAVAVSRLGVDTSFIGKVGSDSFGYALKEALLNKGVKMDGLVFSSDINTTLAFVHLDEHNDRSFSFYRKPGADITLTDKEVDYKLIDQCELLHFSSVSLTDEPSRSATINAVKYARKNNKLISYDPNLRELLWENLEMAKKVIYEMIPYADIVKISEEELVFLTGENDIKKACLKIQALGVPLIFATLGKKGSYYLYKDLFKHHQTYDVNVVDTTGCGDAFVGALIYKIMTRDLRLQHLTENELDEISAFANMVGSLASMKKGGVPSMPDLNEITLFAQQSRLL